MQMLPTSQNAPRATFGHNCGCKTSLISHEFNSNNQPKCNLMHEHVICCAIDQLKRLRCKENRSHKCMHALR